MRKTLPNLTRQHTTPADSAALERLLEAWEAGYAYAQACTPAERTTLAAVDPATFRCLAMARSESPGVEYAERYREGFLSAHRTTFTQE